MNRYDDTWRGDVMIWPPYTVRGVERGVITEREARHVRCNYGSKLSMIDHWFGKVLDAIDRRGLWDDTMVVLCTDHGHYLGDKDLFGKPMVPQYEPLGHTPLYIHYPGVEGPPGGRADDERGHQRDAMRRVRRRSRPPHARQVAGAPDRPERGLGARVGIGRHLRQLGAGP